jgi:hypothetical protein
MSVFPGFDRYAKGQSSIHFHPSGGFRGRDSHDECMVLQRDPSRTLDMDWTLDIPEEFDAQLGSQVLGNEGDGRNQAVLVLNIQLVDDPKPVLIQPLWVLPRLRLLDECPYHVVPNPADLVEAPALIPFRQEVPITVSHDRELAPLGRIGTGAGVNEVVQRGTEVVDAIAEKQGPPDGIGWVAPIGVEPEFGSFRVVLSGHRVAVLLAPLANLLLETGEVFFGAPDLRQGAVEGVRHA